MRITDRAISKWENGICMPDAGIIPKLCKILNITINDLFSGEVIDMKEYDIKVEENLLEIKKEKEESDKKMLKLEYIIGYISSISFMTLVFVASFIEMALLIRVSLIILGFIIFIIGIINVIKIEQVAGYYECGKCYHKYIPTYYSVLFSMHYGRTRYMRFPKCKKRSWQKKVISK